MREDIPYLYRFHRRLGYGRLKALYRAVWCWL
jgi:hypothetical protein